MAKKRMFTMQIVDSDSFLDMPLTAQCLYFHLNMRADDDGFIGNPKRVAKLVGCNDDDLKLLIAKRFVIGFENGVIVIKHWKMHNTIKSDRYSPTAYQDELRLLGIKENKSYTLSGNNLEPKCLQNVSTGLGIGIDLDKDITKVSKLKTVDAPPYQEIIDYLNSKTERHFRVGNDVKRLINARYKDKFTKEDFFKVIDNKCIEWLEDSRMREYLRPQTLFGTKFDSYLNSTPTSKTTYKEEIEVYDASNNPTLTDERRRQLEERRKNR